MKVFFTLKFRTMKEKTLRRRLAKIGLQKNSTVYRIIRDVIRGTNNTYMVFDGLIRPVKTSGSGRFKTNLDYTDGVKTVLDKMNVKYRSGNDAPRGGKTGNWIIVTTKIER